MQFFFIGTKKTIKIKWRTGSNFIGTKDIFNFLFFTREKEK